MVKVWRWALLLSLVWALFAGPVLAAGPGPGDGDIHFGNFILKAGDSISGDQLVMGAAELQSESRLDGELVVFGTLTIASDATVNGSVIAFGAVDVAGEINGDLSASGPVTLRKTAVIDGDVSTAGTLTREEGAVVTGSINEGSGPSGFDWKWGPSWPYQEQPSRPAWMVWLWKVVRAFLALLVFSLLALLVGAVWPEPLGRVADTIVEQPLVSFGMGLLTLVATVAVALVLLVTICLSPFALLGLFVLALAMGVGWIALGYVLGARLLQAARSGVTPNVLGATVLGTFLITFLAVLLNLVGFCLYAPFAYGLASVGLGALILTRAGTRPYQSRGSGYLPPAPMAPPVPPVPPVDVPPADVPPADTNA